MENKKDKLLGIEVLRGIAALFVCCFHYSSNTIPTIGHNIFENIFTYGHLGVQVFFVITGFIMTYVLMKPTTKVDYLTFLLKRSTRIFPVIILVNVLIIAVYYIVSYIKNTPFNISWPGMDLLTLFSNLTLTTALFSKEYYVSVFWTLEIEMQFYLFIGLYVYWLKFIDNRRYEWLYAVSIILLSFTFLLPYPHIRILSYMIFFLFGINLFMYKYSNLNKFNIYFIFAILIILLFNYRPWEESVVVCLTFAIILYAEFLANRVLLYLGKISFSLYATHMLSGLCLEVIIKTFILPPPYGELTKALLMLGYVVFAILTADLFFRLVERPTMIFVKKVKFDVDFFRKSIISGWNSKGNYGIFYKKRHL